MCKHYGFRSVQSAQQSSQSAKPGRRLSPREHKAKGKYTEQSTPELSEDEEVLLTYSASTRSKTRSQQQPAEGTTADRKDQKTKKFDEKAAEKAGTEALQKPAKGRQREDKDAEKDEESEEKQDNKEAKDSMSGTTESLNSNDTISNGDAESVDVSDDDVIVLNPRMKSLSSKARKEVAENKARKNVGKSDSKTSQNELERSTRSSRELQNLSVWSKDKVVDGRSLVRAGRTRGSKQLALAKMVPTETCVSDTDESAEVLSDLDSSDLEDLDDVQMVEGDVEESDSDIEEIPDSGHHGSTVRTKIKSLTVEAENVALKRAIQALEVNMTTLAASFTEKLQRKVGIGFSRY